MKIIYTVIAIAMTFVVSGCTGDSEATPTETVTVTASPEPDNIDDMFVELVKDETDAFDYSSDSEILELADNICKFWESGGTVDRAFDIVVESGVDAYDGGFFVGAATGAYCPEYSDLLEGGTSL